MNEGKRLQHVKSATVHYELYKFLQRLLAAPSNHNLDLHYVAVSQCISEIVLDITITKFHFHFYVHLPHIYNSISYDLVSLKHFCLLSDFLQ